MKKIKIEITAACSLKACSEFRLRLFLVPAGERRRVQLRRQVVRVPRITVAKRFPRRLFRAGINKGGVKILAAGADIGVYHSRGPFHVDRPVHGDLCGRDRFLNQLHKLLSKAFVFRPFPVVKSDRRRFILPVPRISANRVWLSKLSPAARLSPRRATIRRLELFSG